MSPVARTTLNTRHASTGGIQSNMTQTLQKPFKQQSNSEKAAKVRTQTNKF